MLRAIPGVSGHGLKFAMSKVDSIVELVEMEEKGLQEILGEEQGRKAWEFIHYDERLERQKARENYLRIMAQNGGSKGTRPFAGHRSTTAARPISTAP